LLNARLSFTSSCTVIYDFKYKELQELRRNKANADKKVIKYIDLKFTEMDCCFKIVGLLNGWLVGWGG
jgi:hypothetical protein